MKAYWKVSAATVLSIALLSVALVFAGGDTDFFYKSLHHTGEGMRFWYEEMGGFYDITKIPYADPKLDCTKCHVNSCGKCHEAKRGEALVYSTAKAKESETCLACHKREGLTFKMDKAGGTLDVHESAGMQCADCHKGQDVHGDGTFYHSMRSPNAVKVDCDSCHEEGGDGPAMNKEARHHRVHKDKLHCSACHVQKTVSCYNCHLDTLVQTGSRKGSNISHMDWLLLINYENKVTSATMMSLVYKGQPFMLYTPYFTHSIGAKGRGCIECHGTEAAKALAEGKAVTMSTFADGKVAFQQGVFPVVDKQLDWVFLNKKDGQWVTLDPSVEPMLQWVGYGTPFTEAQVRSLARGYTK